MSQTTSAATNYYQFDAEGSTADLTAAATGGAASPVATYSYDPFGNLLSSTGGVSNPFTFVGQYGVSSVGDGLDTMSVRTYDPTTGEFLTSDPSGLASGSSNLRIYAGDDPTGLIDPSGLVSQFFGLSGGVFVEGTVGLTFNSDGQVFLTAGIGGTLSAGLTLYSVSTSDASAGTTLDISATVGHFFGGASASASFGQSGASTSLGGSVGFGTPGVTVQRTTNIPLGNLDSLLGIKAAAQSLTPPPSATHYLFGRVVEDQFNFPEPQPTTTPVTPKPPSNTPTPTPKPTPTPTTTSPSGTAGTSGSPGSAGSPGTTTSDSPSGSSQIIDSGNTQSAGASGPGSGAGNGGSSGNSGSPGDNGDEGSDGSPGTPGSPGTSAPARPIRPQPRRPRRSPRSREEAAAAAPRAPPLRKIPTTPSARPATASRTSSPTPRRRSSRTGSNSKTRPPQPRRRSR